jgi:hypothetical protein
LEGMISAFLKNRMTWLPLTTTSLVELKNSTLRVGRSGWAPVNDANSRRVLSWKKKSNTAFAEPDSSMAAWNSSGLLPRKMRVVLRMKSSTAGVSARARFSLKVLSA